MNIGQIAKMAQQMQAQIRLSNIFLLSTTSLTTFLRSPLVNSTGLIEAPITTSSGHGDSTATDTYINFWKRTSRPEILFMQRQSTPISRTGLSVVFLTPG